MLHCAEYFVCEAFPVPFGFKENWDSLIVHTNRFLNGTNLVGFCYGYVELYSLALQVSPGITGALNAY